MHNIFLMNLYTLFFTNSLYAFIDFILLEFVTF